MLDLSMKQTVQTSLSHLKCENRWFWLAVLEAKLNGTQGA